MKGNKLILDTVFEDEFKLIAIHCSLEPYRIAYFVNKQLKLKLERVSDIEIYQGDTVINAPLFQFEDAIRETDYYLTANKFKASNKNITGDDLFGSKQNRYSIISLLKEYKNADYFLKIEDEDVNAIPIKRILFELNQIKHIVTAYLINTEDLKQKERLVFK
ncbi:IPExxxVDY family protein [Croceibacter atlanticus]|jgi:hypothetical protein|uniref:IPExxxVDY family protein n=1 Tax=Croceibacter atlanticus TaxID=313588 RepID=UPI0024B89776|nr:IPExxxVDY family protein [Croceibacter atlanticus]